MKRHSRNNLNLSFLLLFSFSRFYLLYFDSSPFVSSSISFYICSVSANNQTYEFRRHPTTCYPSICDDRNPPTGILLNYHFHLSFLSICVHLCNLWFKNSPKKKKGEKKFYGDILSLNITLWFVLKAYRVSCDEQRISHVHAVELVISTTWTYNIAYKWVWCTSLQSD